MSTQSRIQGVRLKAERAKKHIRDVDSGIRTFCDSEPYTLEIEPKPQIQHVALYVSSVEPIPDEISLMIGDAFTISGVPLTILFGNWSMLAVVLPTRTLTSLSAKVPSNMHLPLAREK